MSSFFYDYGLFFAKIFTLVLALVVILAVARKKHHDDDEEALDLSSLNERYEQQREQLETFHLDKKELKARRKAKKKEEKNEEKSEKPTMYILEFYGDIEASEVAFLRRQISAILQVVKKDDEVLLCLESSGGFVHSYGLAASQLARLKAHGVRLVIAVDKVAASGGYMMACLADELIAAPFAIVGSVGVIGALPNFHDLLIKNSIQYEEHTAGEHKRSLTMFGENTDADRTQFRHELATTHDLFKAHIQHARPALDVDAIATGETWYGSEALAKGLIDRIGTSDDYILEHAPSHHLLLVREACSESFLDRLKTYFLGKIAAPMPFKMRIR